MSKWQPIETAPKDGTKILGYGLCEYVWRPIEKCEKIIFIAYHNSSWGDGWYFDINDEDGSVVAHLTHWIPLPKPPKETE